MSAFPKEDGPLVGQAAARDGAPPDDGRSETSAREPAGPLTLSEGPPADPSALLAAIVESTDDAILSKDLNGIITSWNRAAERMYGYTTEEAVGHPVSMLLPPEQPNEIPSIMKRLRQGERIEQYETVRRAKDGRDLDVSLTISPIRTAGGRIVGASTIARDITRRRRMDARWQLLADVSEALSATLDDVQVLRDLARLAVRDLADYCVTYLLEGEDRIRRVGVVHGDPAQAELVRELLDVHPPALSDELGAGAVIRTGNPVLAREVPEGLLEQAAPDARYHRILTELGPVSSMILPLRARGRTVGAVAFQTTSRSGHRYDEDDLAFAGELADRAALALDNARLYGQARRELALREAAEEGLRRRYAQLTTLHRLSEAVARASVPEEIYDQAIEALLDSIGADRASILLFDDDGVLRFKAHRGLSDGYRHAVEGHTPWSPDTLDAAPIVVADVTRAEDLEQGLRRSILDEGIRALAFIPLTFRRRLLGKFMVYFDAPRRLTEEDLGLAATIAGTVAFGIGRVRDELSIRAAKEAAERASEAKSQFLGIVSHELRTPLNAVMGYADLLVAETRGGLNEGQREQVERIRSSALHQLELIEEILAYTRLEAGREEPRVLRTDARRVVTDVAEFVRPEAERKGLELSVSLPDEPLELHTDPARLRQVLLNLAGNATKYTEAGRVTLRGERRGDGIRVVVQDTGTGIPADKLEYIFEPFAQVDESRTRATGGTGLGLAIARRLARLLGGDISVESRLGDGSGFVVDIPDAAPGS